MTDLTCRILPCKTDLWSSEKLGRREHSFRYRWNRYFNGK